MIIRPARAVIVAVEGAAMAVAGASIVAVMGLVVADVALRYWFRAPLTWSYDLISIYLIAALFFPALAHSFRHGHHISVDILYLRFPERVQRACDVVAQAMMLVLLVLIIAVLADRTWTEFTGAQVMAGYIEWPVWIATAIALFGMLGFLVRLAVSVVAAACAIVTGGADEIVPHAPEGGEAL